MTFKKIIISIVLLIGSVVVKGQESKFITVNIPSPVAANNLFNEDTTQQVAIYLPPSYEMDLSKRYPVVYLLGGFGTPVIAWSDGWSQGYRIKESMDALIENETIKEMIFVAVEGINFLVGTFYDNSELTGNWEDHITSTLIEYMDNNYRTIANKDSRALAGHSMGGYGALNLSMKRPDLFSIGFGMNPGLFDQTGLAECQMFATQNAIDTYFNIVDYLNTLPDAERHNAYVSILNEMKSGWDPNVFTFAYGSTFSANLYKKAPYFDYPFSINNGEQVLDSSIWQKWDNGYGNLNSKVENYKDSLRKLKAYVIDCGTEDAFEWIPKGCSYYSELLTEKDISHVLNLHNGDHGNMLRSRIEDVLMPLCDSVLVFDTSNTYYFGQTPPSNTAEVFAPGIISLPNRYEQAFCYGVMDSACFLSLSDEMWSTFTIQRKSISDTGWSVEHRPGFLPEDNYGLTPVFHPIENKVFFPGNSDNPYTTDIYSSEKINGVWSTPEKCETPINSDGSDWHLSFENDGTIYFSSYRAGTVGEIDIYKMDYQNGEYSNLTNMGSPINTGRSDCTPLISPQGDFMIIESTRNGGFGNYDIYVSFKKDDGSWYEPITLGSGVNTQYHDMAPAFSPDMKYLFFTRRDAANPSAFSDIYWVNMDLITEIKENLPPEWNVSVNEQSTSYHLQVFPNPASSTIYLSSHTNQLKTCVYSLYDVSGKLVKSGSLNNDSINVSDLSKGIYQLVLQSDKDLLSKKLIIE